MLDQVRNHDCPESVGGVSRYGSPGWSRTGAGLDRLARHRSAIVEEDRAGILPDRATALTRSSGPGWRAGRSSRAREVLPVGRMPARYRVAARTRSRVWRHRAAKRHGCRWRRWASCSGPSYGIVAPVTDAADPSHSDVWSRLQRPRLQHYAPHIPLTRINKPWLPGRSREAAATTAGTPRAVRLTLAISLNRLPDRSADAADLSPADVPRLTSPPH